MLRRHLLPLLLFLAGISGGNGAAQPLRFLYPDRDDLEFLPGDVINLSYETNFTEPYLITWCRPGNVSRLEDTIRVPAGNDSFPVTLSSAEYGDTRCWFDIEESEDRQGLNKNSPAFNYVNDTRSSGPRTFGLSSTTQPETALSTPPPGSTAASTTTTLPTDSPEPSGLSTGAVAGIGIGAAVAGVVLVAILAVPVLVLRWKKKKQRQGQDLSQKTGRYKHMSSIAALSDTHELSAPHKGWSETHHIGPTLRPQEMDAEQTQRYEVE
ncbi:hypothetical protein KVR01_007535 [Diaporthe batatas]|uniref:uncharacterized protein n=1 Tax=Diaporthe batatas TaxID=748121 RepID=UPI001D037BBC|nr:uncharacterized protein KVR01_007535 [Diaporthe batatas]KAG8163057.1 hypothetical protein KVR01_007535 [Diaporthe batatas]